MQRVLLATYSTAFNLAMVSTGSSELNTALPATSTSAPWFTSRWMLCRPTPPSTSITAFEETSVYNADDNGGGIDLYFIPHQDADYDQFSQEIRLQGETDNFRWIGGIYYFDEDMRLATSCGTPN